MKTEPQPERGGMATLEALAAMNSSMLAVQDVLDALVADSQLGADGRQE